jgi:uncharacterized protein involved in tellurium resistance
MKKANVEQVKGLNKKVQAIMSDDSTSKSFKMKALFDLGITVKEISIIVGTRYNFVYNVISNYSNVTGIKTVTTKKEGKKEKIVALHLEGKSKKEISIELKTNYNYVFNVIKEFTSKTDAATN